jgi:hypothetical protein
MHFTSFWKNWPLPYRTFWYFIAAVFCLSLVYMWYSYSLGASGVIDWERIQEQKTIETTIQSFRLGPFQLTVPADSYVIMEYLSGSDVHHNVGATYLFLLFFTIAIVTLLTIATTLERIWYFVAMSLFIVLMVSLRFEVLHLFGVRGLAVPLIIITLYLLLSFYFKYFRNSVPFLQRFALFSLLTFLLFVSVFFFSEVSFPFIHLLVTAYTPALILCLLFIIIVAHEIIVAFVFIASNQGKEGGSPKHFSLLSFIYVLYVIITCLHEMRVIDWNLIYINIYLLLSLSALFGVWGYRLREPQYEGIFPFHPYGAFFYLALGSICFATIGQLLGNWNDASLKVVRDITIFTHTGFGVVFIIYFFSNFLGMMAANIPVLPLLYKPNRMPYFTFRLAGLIVSLAFVFYSQWMTYVYQATGGFYNYVADLYIMQGDEQMGMTFYDQSRARAFENNRGNYALAKLRTARFDLERARTNYQSANARRPTEFSYTNEANLHFWTGSYFDAIEAFRDARKRMPRSAALKNNLGYTFAKVHALDSASFYLNEARKSDLTKQSGEANFLAMAAAEYIPIKADSVLTLFGSENPVVEANAVALATLFRQPVNVKRDLLSGEPLGLYTATLLNNYIVKNVADLDTAWIDKAFEVASDTNNLSYREALKASLAYAYYQKGKVYKALEILGELAYITQNYQGKFNYTMGLWALEQGDPTFAASYFVYADAADYKQAKFYRTIALTESGDPGQALSGWDSLLLSDDQGIRTLATQMKKILTTPFSQALSLPDGEKYQFCRYRLGLKDTTIVNTLVNTFENVNYKGQVLLDFATKFYESDRLIPAIHFLRKTSGLALTDKTLFEKIRYLELLMLASRGEIRLLASQINKGVEFDRFHQLEKMLFTALISEASGDLKTAEINYNVLAEANPFFEEGILAAAAFFRKKDPSSHKPYDILTDAMYLNARSIRLVKAYADEAARMGFDEYAVSARETLNALELNLR